VRRALGPTGGFEHFIQDNARPHLMLAKNLKLQGHKLPVWPPYSPDLNPIETVWASLHRRVSEKHARSTTELKRAVLQAWAEFPQAEINKHVLSFRRRLEDCLDRDGEPK
jgi:transposase